MSYNDKVKKSQQKAHNTNTATKILDLMNKLRRESGELSERRWIWELIQNAKDIGYEGNNVSVEINFDRQSAILEFTHNGKPFSVDNITFLVEQVSTKEREVSENERPATTGKFGTGFLTTHLLSEIVLVEGVIKDYDDEGKEMPYKKFSLLLDRSGRTIEEITNSVNGSISILENLDNYPIFNDYKEGNFNTIFKYSLDEKGIKVTEIGISDLKLSLPFTLAFVPKLKSVSVRDENLVFEISSVEKLDSQIKLVKITKRESVSISTINIIVVEDEDENICISSEIEIKDNIFYVKEFAKLTPRLFCDFPLIGTEDFQFPVIINSPCFSLTDPRDGVWLTDPDRTDEEIEENKRLMKKALFLYYHLLDFASKNNWQDLFNIVAIKQASEKNWISRGWFEKEILKEIKSRIIKTPIVDTEQGERLSPRNDENNPNIWFPSSAKREVIEKIWELANAWIPKALPRKSEIHSWYNVLWSDFAELDLNFISNSVQSSKNINTVAEMLSKDEDEAIDWLNLYFDLLNLESKFIIEVINDKWAIIPDQNGHFKKRSELLTDSDIEEELKNVLLILDHDIRGLLRHKRIVTRSAYKTDLEGVITYYPKTQDNVIDQINKILEEAKNLNSAKAISHLISLFADDEKFPIHREKIYNYCTELIREETPEKKKITNWNISIWKQCDPRRIARFVQIIAEKQNIENLSVFLNFNNVERTIKWLDTFIAFIVSESYENQLNLKTAPILPNQNGTFKTKDDLKLDNGEIDKTLKDISRDLGYDFRDDLLNIDIYLALPENRVVSLTQIAQKITELIKPKFQEIPRSPETKQVFKSLYLWFNKDKYNAEKFFEELFTNKHRLYDDDEIAEHMLKAEMLDEILIKENISFDEFKILAENGKLKQVLDGKYELSSVIPFFDLNYDTEDQNIDWMELSFMLIGMLKGFIEPLKEIGITNLDEFTFLIQKFKNNDFLIKSDAYNLKSVPDTFDKVEHENKITVIAVMKVISHLTEKEGYEIIEIDTNFPTIATVRHDGNVFKIVIRPSHYKKYKLYKIEKDILSDKNSELWLSDGYEVKRETFHSLIIRISGTKFIPLDFFVPGREIGKF